MILLLYCVFVLSGAAGLVYESIWSRYLGLFVGHSAYAQVIVLVIFLGGMSLGALMVGRRSERMRAPLLWYAGIEFAVGAIGIVFHPIFTWVTSLAYDQLFPALASGGDAGSAMVLVVKWLLAALLILPQSILLGATFPLMSAGALRLAAERPAGRVIASLYFANSVGAATGVLAAGFILVARFGLPGTLLAAAILNMVVAGIIVVAVRVRPEAPAAAGAPSEAASPASPASAASPVSPAPRASRAPRPALWRPLLVVSFGTAVASFIYEIAWIRMLSLVLGSATHAFELMLSAFILGLALGALWVRRRIDRFRDPVRALGIIQWVMGSLAVATLPLYVASFEVMVAILRALDLTGAGYVAFNVLRYAICLAIMLPATFCAGATLPIITRILLAPGAGAPNEEAIGAVYGVNTFGSIVGAALAGLVLMPLLGLKLLLVAGALVDIGLGLYLLARVARDARGALSARGARHHHGLGASGIGPMAVAAAAVVALVAVAANFDRTIMTSGVFRYGSLPDPQSYELLFYEDGRTATVTAKRHKRSGVVTISTNGKPDASLDDVWLRPQPDRSLVLSGDQATQVLVSILTLAFNPGAREAAVIGQGSGMTSHYMLGSPVLERLTTIDIEPEMVRGSRVFYPANRRVFDDPRSRFVIDDAKSYFAAAGRRFDVIISEPSNPWVSGVSGLFTTEFYGRVRRYLADGGVFSQWLHTYEITDDLVLSVVRALHENFASYVIYQVSRDDLLVVASMRDSLPAPDWSVVDRPDIARDLRAVAAIGPKPLDALKLASREVFTPLMGSGAPANSDFRPILDLRAERTRFLRTRAAGFSGLGADRFDPVAALGHDRHDFLDETRAFDPEVPRLAALALGAQLRADRAQPPPPPIETTDSAARAALPRDEKLLNARFRQTMLAALLGSGRPAPDWRIFTTHVLDAERDVHGGTAGTVDEEFYRPVYAYMRAHAAPAEAVASVDFVRAVGSWDWPTAARAADTLIAVARAGDEWVNFDLLRDGTVVARLYTGDVAGARKAYAALGGRSRRTAGDLRNQILEAFIRAAEREKAH